MHQMLFEMARGNFNMQVPLTGPDDELETLLVLVNMVAEELKESVFHSGYVNPHGVRRPSAPVTFILGPGGLVRDISGASEILGYAPSEILGRPISQFIANGDGGLFDAVIGPAAWERPVQLHFLTSNSLMVAAECHLSELLEGGRLLSFTTSSIKDFASLVNGQDEEGRTEKSGGARKADARLIQKVYDYILANLGGPLPSLKELARKFATNEFKLKDGFRHFFQTSIYQFYTEERLKSACLMMRQTDMPLKNIALLNGFNSYPNFSRTFKKHYGVPPSEMVRNF